jgi:hypothetical protein
MEAESLEDEFDCVLEVYLRRMSMMSRRELDLMRFL